MTIPYAKATGMSTKNFLLSGQDNYIKWNLINPEALQGSFISWVNAACKLTDDEVVAIDETVRRSFRRGNRKSATHMVSAWATEQGLAVGQGKVDTKSNEITAIPHLLEVLDLTSCIVTIDAIGCQRA